MTDQKTLNRLAQYLYEEIQDQPHIAISMPMTAKSELVAALERAIDRVQQQAVAEFNSVMQQVADQWAAVQPAITEAVAQLLSAIQPEKVPNAWKAIYKHDECILCEHAAELAIQRAKEHGTESETATYHHTPLEQDAHQATVTRVHTA